ncbi:MAG: c-type cytochrome [Gemmatimonadetes bacterium]|nr:c-type cytochrome [Gemmatimonadota bacterium]
MILRRIWALTALAALAACGGGEPAQEAPVAETAAPASTPAATPATASATVDLTGVTLPEGVTAEMVNAGAAAWPPQACIACHGPDAHGVASLGPNLTDATWLHSDGSYPAIVNQIKTGVPQPKEAAGPMLPRGGTTIDDALVANLAAYIWAISHKGSRPAAAAGPGCRRPAASRSPGASRPRGFPSPSPSFPGSPP